ncbi:MAG TPA: hypothetical protein VEC38_04545 [Candidatus Binataceae bacterium]|nr:hypothetical protein [Candidatus Binataceae bacterium]
MPATTDRARERLSKSPRAPLFPLSGCEWVWLALASLGFAAIFCYPMLCAVGEPGPGVSGWLRTGPIFGHLARPPANGDADMFAELRWAPYWTVAHFHQAPFWNPYKCGGLGLLSNPETSIVTPFFLLYLVFGAHAGEFLDIFFHVAVAFAGGYVLGRVLRLGTIAAIVCASLFPASSWLYLHLAVGHLNFLPATYLPWVVAFLLASVEQRKLYPAAIGGAVCALTLTEGNYTFLYTAIVIGSIASVLTVLRLSLRPFVSGLVIGIFALGFGALRLIPMWQQLNIYPKHPFGLEELSFQNIAVFLFARNQDLYRSGTWEFMFCEYGAYVSLAFGALMLIGLCSRPIRALPWLLPAVMFLLFTRGNTGPHAAVFMLRYFPLSQSAGLSGRYLIPFVFCVGVIAALGADFLCSRLGSWGTTITIILLGAAVADSWLVGPPNLRYLFHGDVSPVPYSPIFRQYWVPNPGIQTEINEANMGSVNCQGYGYNDIPEAALGYNQPGYRGEYYLSGAGSVTQTLWTPNRLEYDADAPAPVTLVVNQNYYPGWRLLSSPGELVHAQLLSVALPAGREHIILRYRPERLQLAIALTMIAGIATVLTWRTDA